MVVRRGSRGQTTSRIPRSYWIVGVVAALVIAGGLAVVWRGCSRGRSDPYAAWSGMSKEEFLKKRQERAEAEAKQQAEEAKRAEEEKKKRDEEKKKKDEEAAAKRAVEQKQSKPERKKAVGRGADDADSSAADQAPEIPPIPREFTQWKDFDFFVARLTHNPRLALAVEQRSKHTPRDEGQAEFFEKLLAPQGLAELKQFAGKWSSSEGGDRDAPTAAIEAIAAALARNGTEKARRTLAALLAGTMAVENDQAAVVAALRALAMNPSKENDRLLAAAVFEPDMLRAAGQGQVSPENLRQQAVAVVAEHGKSGIRLLAAKRFVDPACPPEARKLLPQVWLRPHPENLEACVFLNERPELDAPTRGQIMRQLVALSGRATWHFLGIARFEGTAGFEGTTESNSRGQAVENELPDPELPYRVACQLWKADLARAIDARRSTVRSMEEARDWFLLAATVPRSDVRSRLARLLERRWEEGPPVARSSGSEGRETLVVEPGILTVLRSVRRGRPGANPNSVKARASGQRPSAANKDPWLDFEGSLVQDFCRRFLEAAVQPNHGAEEKKPTPAAGEAESLLPVALHPQAEVVAQYRVRWPGDHAAKLAAISPDPMDVVYLRIEQKARPMNVRGHYAKVLKGPGIHPITDGVWLETLLATKDGASRSIDVLLTRANPKVAVPPEEIQEITVEILSVAVAAMESGTPRRAGASEPTDGTP